MKSPKERTALFEELSRSIEYQAEYDRLKAEMLKADEESQVKFNTRRVIAQEKKEARTEKDEAEKYQQMKDELALKQRCLVLHQLYHCERHIKEYENELKEQKKKLDRLVEAKEEKDNAVSEQHKKTKEQNKKVHKIEKEIAKREKEINDQRPIYVQAKAEVTHTAQKIATAKKAKDAAEAQADQNEEQKKKLKEKLDSLEDEKKKFENEADKDKELKLSEDQLNEYQSLNRKAMTSCARILRELNSVKSEDDNDRSALTFEESKLREMEQAVASKEKAIKSLENQLKDLATRMADVEKSIKEDRKAHDNSAKDLKASKKELEEKHKELAQANRELADVAGEIAEGDRTKRRNEAIENLIRVFPDKIHGRLFALVPPSHKKYQLAVTKVLAGHMMSIVCDSEEIAHQAISYLREQRYEPETFLPADNLDVHPISERVRNLAMSIRNPPPGLQLIFDIIKVENPHARKALQFVCGNTLICDNQNDAKQLAFGNYNQERYKAISLDGTMFQPTGVIAGGGADLAKKAKKWDEKHSKEIKDRKAKLEAEIKELTAKMKSELNVDQLQSRISSSENKLRSMKQHKENEEKRLETLRNQLEITKSELETIPPRIKELEGKIKSRQKLLKELEDQSNSEKDKIFADFCRQLGIRNIREYEDRELKIHAERQKRQMEFNNQIDQIKSELKYLDSEDRTAKFKREEDKVKALEKQLTALKEKEKKEKETLNRLEADLDNLKTKAMTERTELEELEAQLADVKKDAQGASREVASAEKSNVVVEAQLARKQHERHTLLHNAKINQIDLPLNSGSLDKDVTQGDEGDDAQSQSTMTTDPEHSQVTALSQDQIRRESRIKINYRDLPDESARIDKDTRSAEDKVKQITEKLNKEIGELQNTIGRYNAPNLKADQRLDEVRKREEQTSTEFDSAREKAKKAKNAFDKVKTERCNKFAQFFRKVEESIDEIYKKLSRNPSAQAFLGPNNMEEPYLDGIEYSCVAPGKRFRPMDNLSGGEKTVAALALLFAMRGRKPSPFFVLDEIDAALDNTNISKVANYISEDAMKDMQIIVISLKEEFFNKADSLIGVYPLPAACTTSGILTFDLTKFRNTALSDATNNSANNQ
ncbi:hypothetical protein WR25_16729 isoform D [Diploscapter pachys]|uniref:SMC hinge domain-containing protein n=1 Tax=Diploscapter pachys TaxID=2018661 RepID=A0A2A2JLD7_9BILA|nr:hypothetical protein WR25_16729 isoform A [Diploscapter pachys]PAV62337.1 hypothetical protein WR25_16729 isoform B [Diploscapter pachys]PAV62338.1 hypothetical protein WR25_16729 isoform C [Diploscapter pachys]PAV62339.1 hypothetical protein WR25_16729 isoform D [Diploscapter pachys]